MSWYGAIGNRPGVRIFRPVCQHERLRARTPEPPPHHREKQNRGPAKPNLRGSGVAGRLVGRAYQLGVRRRNSRDGAKVAAATPGVPRCLVPVPWVVTENKLLPRGNASRHYSGGSVHFRVTWSSPGGEPGLPLGYITGLAFPYLSLYKEK
jgi:hypothetical protein